MSSQSPAAAVPPAERLPRDVWELDARVQPDAAEQYARACAHLFDITIAGPPEAFCNRLEAYRLEGAVFGRCQGVAQRFQRTRAHILADATDSIQVIVALGGAWRGDYDGNQVDSSMGSLRIIDMARPFDVDSEAFETLNLMLPRAAMGQRGLRDVHGLVVSESGGAGQLLGAYLRALWSGIASQTLAGAASTAAAAAALVEGVIASRGTDAPVDPRPVKKILMAAARAYADAHLADPELTPERIRGHLGVSRSFLYELFEPVGGVSSFIQARRLDRAFDAIVADQAAQRTLGEIGYDHGFRSDAHFSRAFRQRFGIPPGGLRSRRGDARAADFSMAEQPQDALAWLKSL